MAAKVENGRYCAIPTVTLIQTRYFIETQIQIFQKYIGISVIYAYIISDVLEENERLVRNCEGNFQDGRQIG